MYYIRFLITQIGGGVWRKHHEEFADFLHEYKASGGILEIGGGNGFLNAYYNSEYEREDWVIVDPTTVEYAEGCTAKVIKALWNDKVDIKDTGFSTLVHSHLMEHQYDLHSFMKLNSKVLPLGGRMVFSLPNLNQWIKKKYSNALFWEHTYLIGEEYLDAILAEYGFSLIQKKYFGDGHSIFYATEKNKDKLRSSLDGSLLYEQNKNIFQDWIDYMEEKASYYNQKCAEFVGKVYLFGAHIFSQMLIEFGLNTEKVSMILDNDPHKHGKRLYGTPYMVSSPEIIKHEKSMVLLNAGAYQDEIKEGLIHTNAEVVIVE